MLKVSGVLIIVTAVLALSGSAGGEADFGLAVGCHSRTGDFAWDARLRGLDLDFGSHRDESITDLCEHYRMTRSCVLGLLDMVRMSPADVYLSIRLHGLTLEPVNAIVEIRKANRGQGRGVVSKKPGVKPGSVEFDAFKRDDRGRFYAGAGGRSGFRDHGRSRQKPRPLLTGP